MQIKKSLRFLLISMCIMFVHNAVFGECPSTDQTLATGLYDFYTGDKAEDTVHALKFVNTGSNKCYYFAKCNGDDEYIILKSIKDSTTGKTKRAKFCVSGSIASSYGYGTATANITTGNEGSKWPKCASDSENKRALNFDTNYTDGGLVADIKCKPKDNVPGKYIFSYVDTNSNTLYNQIHLDQYTYCSGDPISEPPYGAKSGKYGVDISSSTCVACASNQRFVKGENDAPNECRPCTEPGYGVNSNNECKKCNNGAFSYASIGINSNGGIVQNDNTCISTGCNEAGMGIAEEDNGGYACRRCDSNTEVVYNVDENNNACINKDVCMREGWGIIRLKQHIAECVFCSGATDYEGKRHAFYKYDSELGTNVCTKCTHTTEPGYGFDEYLNGKPFEEKQEDQWGYYNIDNDFVNVNMYETPNGAKYFPMECKECAANQVVGATGKFKYLYKRGWTEVSGSFCLACENGKVRKGVRKGGTGTDANTCDNCEAANELFYDGSCKPCSGNKILKDLGKRLVSGMDGQTIEIPEGRECVECPSEYSEPNNDHTECVCKENGYVKQPGTGYNTNPMDFTCKAECNDGTAIWKYDESTGYNDRYGHYVKNNNSNVCETCPAFWQRQVDIDIRDNSSMIVNVCLPQCDTANGYGTLPNSNECVKCSDSTDSNTGETMVLKSNGTCGTGCDDYQVKEENGTCKFCGEGTLYDYDSKTCINVSECTGDKFILKSTWMQTQGFYNFKWGIEVGNNDDTVTYLCYSCSEGLDRRNDRNYAFGLNNVCVNCAQDRWYDSSKAIGNRCSECPTNFACNGKIKKKCPYGSISGTIGNNGTITETKGECHAGTDDNLIMGFGSVDGDGFKIDWTQEGYDNISDEDEATIAKFTYVTCSVSGLNARTEKDSGLLNLTPSVWADKGYGDFFVLDPETNTYSVNTSRHDLFSGNDKVAAFCKPCDTGYGAYQDTCVCGRSNPKYGLARISDIETSNSCIKCFNNTHTGTCDDSSNISDCTCNGCPDGMGYDPTSTNGCVLCVTESNASINNLCQDVNRAESILKGAATSRMVMFDEGIYGYQWVICTAGSCCDNGKGYACAQGTLSTQGEHCAAHDDVSYTGQCLHTCTNGYTTNVSAIDNPEDLEDDSWQSVCTIPLGVSNFCIGNYNSAGSQNQMCFVPDKTKMPFDTVMNIRKR